MCDELRLIVGCGYLGQRVARLWKEQGSRVVAVTRSAERATAFASQGIEPIVADVTRRSSLSTLPNAKTVLYAVGYDRKSGDSIESVYVDGLRNVLDVVSHGVDRFIYISSTGVYGPEGGDWVDEHTPCRPVREGGKACLAAESLLADHSIGCRSIVLRLAGIYGPDRLPYLAALRNHETIEAQPDGNLNLIHVDDAARIVLDVEQRAPLPRTYCVSDGTPVIRGDYYKFVAESIGAPPPKFNATGNGARVGRGSADKRISNQRLVEEIGPKWEYPSYREGIAAIVKEMA